MWRSILRDHHRPPEVDPLQAGQRRAALLHEAGLLPGVPGGRRPAGTDLAPERPATSQPAGAPSLPSTRCASRGPTSSGP
eukprot:1230464-Alexandrium_andersonii.AAC.1